jgi:hypothetical protein
VFDISFTPPLRGPVPSGTQCLFDKPTGLFRLAEDDGMSLELQGHRFASPVVNMVEAF